MEDLDPNQSSRANEELQIREMASLGIDWNGEVLRQSERFHLYDEAIDDLDERGLIYECFCSRREVRAEIEAAPHAPHMPPGSYPGTCRNLDRAARERRRADGRPPALRLRTNHEIYMFTDRVHGQVEAAVDDVVLRRNDGTPAYNLAVVIDDGRQGVTEVVRGDDLLLSTPRHLHLQLLLGLPQPDYAHVPLVMGDDGERLAKRHGGATLENLADAGVDPGRVVAWIGSSLGLNDLRDQVELADFVGHFDWSDVPREPCIAPDLRPEGAQ